MDSIIDVNEMASVPTLTWVQQAIEDYYPISIQIPLRNLLKCDRTVVPQEVGDDEDREMAIPLVTNGEKARFLGLMHCNSIWACPHCTAHIMGKRATRIIAAIEQYREQGKSAIMMTFTVRHHAGMPSTMAYDILREAWKVAMSGRNSGVMCCGAVKRRMLEIADADYISNVEFTYGKNGWHPHIHCLFWVRDDELPNITQQLEEELRDAWNKCVARAAVFLYWHGEPLNGFSKRHVSQMIRDEKFPEMSKLGRYAKAVYKYFSGIERRGFYISRDKEGNVTVAKSGDYVCDLVSEVADGNMKHAREGHYNIREILIEAKKAFDSIPNIMEIEDKEQLFATEGFKRFKFFMDRYIEYFLMTKRRKRMVFTWNVNDTIRDFMMTHELEEFVKKNMQETPKFELVAVFDECAWSSIMRLGLKDIILRTVVGTDTPREDLLSLLELFDIRLSDKPPDPDDYADCVKTLYDEQDEVRRWEFIFDIPRRRARETNTKSTRR